MDIKKIVNSLVKKHKTRNPFEIIKGLNVILVPVPLKGVRGFYQYFQRNNIIYIDDSLPEHEQILVCAHELGHIILHSETNSISLNSRTHLCTSKYEREADLFAVNLLLQDETFSTYEGLSVVEISRITHIPLKLITLKYFPE